MKGSHISGGQKQRVAIARVILRQPHVLLLDEATSALDSYNEKKVQESLDRMMTGKTSITIAHRIDTIKNSDQIFVFHLGKLVETGTYDNLMSKKGYFYSLEKGLEILWSNTFIISNNKYFTYSIWATGVEFPYRNDYGGEPPSNLSTHTQASSDHGLYKAPG